MSRKGDREVHVWPGGLSDRVWAGWVTFDGDWWVNDGTKYDVTDDVNAIIASREKQS